MVPTAPRQRFGLVLATALVVGNIVGSAIFMLPAGLAPYGWNVLSAWAFTATGALALAWVFSQLARHFPEDGGSFAFMRAGAGRGGAFLGAWGYVVSVWAGNAAITIAGVSYLTRLLPPLGQTAAGPPIAALGAIWLLTWVNLRGNRAAGGVQLVSSVVKLLPFVVVIGLAAWRLMRGQASALPPLRSDAFTFAGTSGALSLTLFSMLGLESAAVPADAVDRPERTVPAATMLGTGVSLIVTVIATCAAALMLPAAQVSASKAPISDFIATSWGDVAGGFVAVAAVVSCFGCLNGWQLLSGELPAAMADRAALPAWFGRRNAGGAAARSILLGSVVTSLLVLMASSKVGIAGYNFMALVATATSLVMYLLCVLAAARFMRAGRVPRSASLVLAVAVSFVFVLWAFYGSGREALGWGALLILCGWPVHRLAARAASATGSLR